MINASGVPLTIKEMFLVSPQYPKQERHCHSWHETSLNKKNKNVGTQNMSTSDY
jgi:hypothetical protein